MEGSFDSQTALDEAAPRKARLRRARLHISGGVRYMNTQATQLSGMSPRPGPLPVPFAPLPSVRFDNVAPISLSPPPPLSLSCVGTLSIRFFLSFVGSFYSILSLPFVVFLLNSISPSLSCRFFLSDYSLAFFSDKRVEREKGVFGVLRFCAEL